MNASYNRRHVHLDVRSPREYAEGHIPGAVSLPILDDLERHEVGWLYKNASIEEAKIRGAVHGSAKIQAFIETVSRLSKQNNAGEAPADPEDGRRECPGIVIYCARGGYRSRSVTALLSSIGMPVSRLDGGYKAYRRYVLERLRGPFPSFIGINGLTGSGKTHILHELASLGEPVLDLERAANHKGSTLGAIGTSGIQCVQQFENDIVDQLDRASEAAGGISPESAYCFVEMESRKIGKLTVPAALYAAYHDLGCQIGIERSREERIDNLLTDYTEVPPDEFRQGVDGAIERIRAYLAPEAYREIRAAFSGGDHRRLAELLLDCHYDPKYRKSIGDPQYLKVFRGSSNREIATMISEWIQSTPPALWRRS